MRASDDTEIEFFIGAWSIGVIEVFQNLLEYGLLFYGGIFFCDNRVGRNSIYTIGWRFGVQKTLGA